VSSLLPCADFLFFRGADKVILPAQYRKFFRDVILGRMYERAITPAAVLWRGR
jgi:hypothetical protein